MRLAKHDPELAGVLSNAEEAMPYTVEQFRLEILRLTRRLARLHNAVRLAETLSTDKRVKKILSEAKGI